MHTSIIDSPSTLVQENSHNCDGLHETQIYSTIRREDNFRGAVCRADPLLLYIL